MTADVTEPPAPAPEQWKRLVGMALNAMLDPSFSVSNRLMLDCVNQQASAPFVTEDMAAIDPRYPAILAEMVRLSLLERAYMERFGEVTVYGWPQDVQEEAYHGAGSLRVLEDYLTAHPDVVVNMADAWSLYARLGGETAGENVDGRDDLFTPAAEKPDGLLARDLARALGHVTFRYDAGAQTATVTDWFDFAAGDHTLAARLAAEGPVATVAYALANETGPAHSAIGALFCPEGPDGAPLPTSIPIVLEVEMEDVRSPAYPGGAGGVTHGLG